MRCPICDFNPDEPDLSIYFSGVYSPAIKNLKQDFLTGEMSCSCFDEYDDFIELEDVEELDEDAS